MLDHALNYLVGYATCVSRERPINSNNKVDALSPISLTGFAMYFRYFFRHYPTLCYNLNPLPQVTFIGQRTGGGSGSVADGYLANGWYWSLSTSEFIDHLGNHLDDGIEPDIAVALDTLDTSMDEVIEAAILQLQ